MQRRYFDHNASTPIAPEALQTMVSCLQDVYGNASSIHHFGQQAKQTIERARRETAELLGCAARSVVFTSGGTEADNLAVLGTVRRHDGARHVITTTIEHSAVLKACAQLQSEGVEVTYLPVGREGLVDPSDVRAALRPSTALISVMHANNELGTVQPIAEIGAIAREAGIPFHSDGVQAAGKTPLDMAALNVDLYAISAHKFYGPKGAAALYVREPKKLNPLMHGGNHEQGLRAGTENGAGIAGMGTAAAIAFKKLQEERGSLSVLRDRLEDGILARVPDTGVNGSRAHRTANTSNIYFDGITGESLLIALDLKGFAVSSGSACASGAVTPSHVLSAIGLAPERARASLRLSVGRSNTAADVDALIQAISDSVTQLRQLSPRYLATANA